MSPFASLLIVLGLLHLRAQQIMQRHHAEHGLAVLVREHDQVGRGPKAARISGANAQTRQNHGGTESYFSVLYGAVVNESASLRMILSCYDSVFFHSVAALPRCVFCASSRQVPPSALGFRIHFTLYRSTK